MGSVGWLAWGVSGDRDGISGLVGLGCDVQDTRGASTTIHCLALRTKPCHSEHTLSLTWALLLISDQGPETRAHLISRWRRMEVMQERGHPFI